MSTTRTCPSCGAAAGANERFCANCGTRLPEATPQPSAPTFAPGSTPPPAPPASTPAPPTPLPPLAAPQQGLPADVPAAPPGRKGLPLWAILLLGLAGLCAVGCVGFVLLSGIIGRRITEVAATAIVEGEATIQSAIDEGEATVESALTPEAEPTPEAGGTVIEPTSDIILALPTQGPTPAGTGGVAGGVAGGAASQVQTIQAATAVVAGTAETEALFAEAAVAFQDEFVDNRNAWFVGVFNEIETDRIEDGVFKVIWAGEGTSYELWEVRELTNFIAEVDCLVVQGGGDGSCALVFGTQDDRGFYKYELFEDYYRLFVVPPEGDPQILAEGDPTGLVRPGEAKRLRVIRRGDEIAIALNGAPLAEASDLTYLIGKVGVSTNSYNEAGGVEIWFDNFVIWELPG